MAARFAQHWIYYSPPCAASTFGEIPLIAPLLERGGKIDAGLSIWYCSHFAMLALADKHLILKLIHEEPLGVAEGDAVVARIKELCRALQGYAP